MAQPHEGSVASTGQARCRGCGDYPRNGYLRGNRLFAAFLWPVAQTGGDDMRHASCRSPHGRRSSQFTRCLVVGTACPSKWRLRGVQCACAPCVACAKNIDRPVDCIQQWLCTAGCRKTSRRLGLAEQSARQHHLSNAHVEWVLRRRPVATRGMVDTPCWQRQ